MKYRCGRCRHPGFKLMGASVTGRPQFVCDKCGNTWTYGWHGTPYLEHVMNPEFMAGQVWPVPGSSDDIRKQELGM